MTAELQNSQASDLYSREWVDNIRAEFSFRKQGNVYDDRAESVRRGIYGGCRH